MTDLPNPNLKPKPFALPEYARAQFKFVHEGVRRLMEAKDEVWASLQRRPPTEAVPVTQNTMPGGGVIQNQPVTSKTKFIFKFEDIRLCDTAALAAQMDSAADQQLSVVMPHFFEVLRRTSEAAGTAIDAGGKPFSFETWVEMLEESDLAEAVVEKSSFWARLRFRRQEDAGIRFPVAQSQRIMADLTRDAGKAPGRGVFRCGNLPATFPLKRISGRSALAVAVHQPAGVIDRRGDFEFRKNLLAQGGGSRFAVAIGLMLHSQSIDVLLNAGFISVSAEKFLHLPASIGKERLIDEVDRSRSAFDIQQNRANRACVRGNRQR